MQAPNRGGVDDEHPLRVRATRESLLPVDRALPAHQCRSMHVTDPCIVFDARSHGISRTDQGPGCSSLGDCVDHA